MSLVPADSAPAATKGRRPSGTGSPSPACGTRRSLRLQNKPPPYPVSFVFEPRLARAKRKGSRDSEADADDELNGDRPAKRPRGSTSFLPVPSQELLKAPDVGARVGEPEGPFKRPQSSISPLPKSFMECSLKDPETEAIADESREPPPLSEEGSQLLQSVYKEVMAGAETSQIPTETEDYSSQAKTEKCSCVAETEECSSLASSPTQSSSPGDASYRLSTLETARIRLYVKPPKDVEAIIKGIAEAKPSEKRLARLQAVADSLCEGSLECEETLDGQRGFTHCILSALEGLRFKTLGIAEEARWRVDLKPAIQTRRPRSTSNLDVLTTLDLNAVVPTTDGTTPLAMDDLQGTEALKPLPPASIHTPRPALAIGPTFPALTSALTSLPHLSSEKKEHLLPLLLNLQHELPNLILTPLAESIEFAFPFLVFEAPPDTQLFEAENRAAGAMACAHLLLSALDRLANNNSTNREIPPTPPPPRVLFSIASQGPIYELSAHWTSSSPPSLSSSSSSSSYSSEDNLEFKSKVWDSWNVTVPKRALDFVVALNNVCEWGAGPFMKEVVEGVRRVLARGEYRAVLGHCSGPLAS